ncbi:MAG: succinate dehydrogenase, cytochrome b556 subunit [Alphaproteobacteria bacterium]|nr:succinate dehydrogenase, cytochrome b556 subunit [Alphaproteobacteria bacterium]
MAAHKPRPLSPHLQVYKPQLTSAMSIFHRITGIGLALGLPVFVLWLLLLAGDQPTYDKFIKIAHTLPAQLALLGWTWAFFYHLCTGIRHLLWDAGHFLKIKDVYKTGYIALAVSTALTVYVAYQYLWVAS